MSDPTVLWFLLMGFFLGSVGVHLWYTRPGRHRKPPGSGPVSLRYGTAAPIHVSESTGDPWPETGTTAVEPTPDTCTMDMEDMHPGLRQSILDELATTALRELVLDRLRQVAVQVSTHKGSIVAFCGERSVHIATPPSVEGWRWWWVARQRGSIGHLSEVRGVDESEIPRMVAALSTAEAPAP